jgi:hypothetical protein
MLMGMVLGSFFPCDSIPISVADGKRITEYTSCQREQEKDRDLDSDGGVSLVCR